MWKPIAAGMMVAAAWLGAMSPGWAQSEKTDDSSWSKTVNGLAGRIVFKQKEVFNGTLLIYASLELKNTSETPCRVNWWSSQMKFAIVDADGKAAPRPTKIAYGGAAGRAHDVVIPPGGKALLEMTAGGMGVRGNLAGLVDLGPSDCWQFETSDKDYFLQAEMNITAEAKPDGDKPTAWEGKVDIPRSLVPLKRLPTPKDAKTGELIDQLGATMIGKPYSRASEEAEDKLSLMDDDRVIRWYVKAMDTDSSSLKQTALDRLSRCQGDEALAGLVKGMHTQGSDIGNCSTTWIAHQMAQAVRYSCSLALARSPHPESKELLRSMRRDDYEHVRHIVLRWFAKQNTQESLDLLLEMSQDPDEGVRTEAKEYLELRRKKPE